MKKNIKKLLTLVLLCSICAANVPATIYAEEVAADEPQPYLNIIKTVSISLTKNGSKAEATGYTSASFDATRINMYCELQRYTGGTWKLVTSWTANAADSIVSFSKTFSVGSGKYRVKGTAYAYIGTQKESLQFTSNTLTIN